MRLFLILAALPFLGWTFSAFTAGAIDQHLFEKSLSHTPAADIFVILQGKVNNAPFRRIQRWNGAGFPAFLDLNSKLQGKLLQLFSPDSPEISGI
jgi:hypothetical protein